MEITPASHNSPSAASFVPARHTDGSEEPTAAPEATAPVELAAASEHPDDGIEVQTDRHTESGATITNIVRLDTGDVISQIPLEQVLSRVAFLLAQERASNQHRREHAGD